MAKKDETPGLPPSADTELTSVPTEKIVIGNNVRKRLPDVHELARAIAASGWVDPLMVTPEKGGKYRLIQGHRRLAAVRFLRSLVERTQANGTVAPTAEEIIKAGEAPDTKASREALAELRDYAERRVAVGQPPMPFESLDAQVITGEGAAREMLLQLNENVDRADMTAWENASTVKAYSDLSGAKGAELARALGKSKSATNNLLRVATNIGADPEIRKALDTRPDLLSSDQLNKLAGIEDPAARKEQFDAWTKPKDTAESEPSERRPRARGEAIMQLMLTGWKESQASDPTLDSLPAKDVAKALKFLMGQTDHPPKLLWPSGEKTPAQKARAAAKKAGEASGQSRAKKAKGKGKGKGKGETQPEQTEASPE